MPAMLPPAARPDARLRPVPDAPIHPAVQRVLDAAARKGVTLEVTVFDESTHTAVEAAAAVGADLGQIVKSLVFVVPIAGGLEPILCLVAGHNRVDVARLAAVTSAPDIRRATAREAHDLTGFSIGGIPPIGHDRPIRVIMDPDLGRYPVVWAAAGLPTTVFPIPPGDAAHPVQRDGRADRRGTAPVEAERDVEGAGTAAPAAAPTAIRLARPAPCRRLTPPDAWPGASPATRRSPIRAACARAGDGAAAARRPRSSPCPRRAASSIDLGPTVAADPDALCRAELRLEGPRGAWTARFASLIHDEPRALHWDSAGLLVVAYGFHTLRPRDGDRRRRAGSIARRRRSSPCSVRRVSPTSSSRPRSRRSPSSPTGSVAWRVAHSEVVTAADLLGGRLVLTGFDGQVTSLDPATGRSAS